MRRCSVITTGRLAADHIAALESLHTPVTVDRRCSDLAELIAVTGLHRAEAVLIIGQTRHLTDSVLDQLLKHSVNIVVISDVKEERDRLIHLGVQCFSDEVEPHQLAAALQASSTEPQTQADFHGRPIGGERAQWRQEPDERVDGQLDRSSAEGFFDVVDHVSGVSQQCITVVWGTSGSPGRTTFAVNLAAELTLSGARVLLIDADTHSASAAIHLGLLEESAGLAQACRAAELGGLDAAALERTVNAVEIGGRRCDVLTGLPRADRWPEVRPRAVERLLTLARSLYDHVLIDVGSTMEEDEELSYDTYAPQRNAATLTALRCADRVLCLGTADPVGFTRLLKATEEYRRRLPEATEPEIIVNQLRKEVVGRSPRRQLCEAWEYLGGRQMLGHFVMFDREACDAALRLGRMLAEVAPDSALRRHIASLVGIEVPARRRRLSTARRRARQRS